MKDYVPTSWSMNVLALNKRESLVNWIFCIFISLLKFLWVGRDAAVSKNFENEGYGSSPFNHGNVMDTKFSSTIFSFLVVFRRNKVGK